MNLIVCLEDKNGMMFNKRRLSQDVVIREDIYNNLDKNSLIMNSYSFKMFEKDNSDKDIVVREDLPVEDSDNLQFIEDKQLGDFEDKIDKLIIYYWNRRYPSDLKFNIDLENGKWQVVSEEEFPGNSHEKITKKIIVKK
ncbi:hypothetical protein [Intestinibacter sp.]